MTKPRVAILLATVLAAILVFHAMAYLVRREADRFCREKGYASGERAWRGYTDGVRVWDADSTVCFGVAR